MFAASHKTMQNVGINDTIFYENMEISESRLCCGEDREQDRTQNDDDASMNTDVDLQVPSNSRQRRGPYRKWSGFDTVDVRAEPCTKRMLIEEQDVYIEDIRDKISANTFISKDTVDEPIPMNASEEPDTSDLMSQDSSIPMVSEEPVPPEATCTSRCTAKEYVPPVNDEHELDTLIEEIQSQIAEAKYAELADDSNEFEVLTEHVAQAVQNEDVTITTGGCNIEHGDMQLYSNSVELGAVVLLLCCFVIRFRLSDEALSYLMSFISLLLPPGNKMVQSLYKFRDLLKQYIHPPEISYFCSFCYTHVEKDATQCPNTFCSKDLRLPGATAYFVRHSIITQLQVMFKRITFTQSVRTHRFKHYKNKQTISDIYDGSIYRNLFNEGFLDKENNLSFSFNTDGVPIFKSSKVSMWPVYLLINELPIVERKMRENVLYYGVWISSRKPVMWSFLKPLYDDIAKLEGGVEYVDHLGANFTCKATLLTCTCDLPARCMVSNSVQFNGKHSCWYCLQPGETYRTESGGNCHIFPYQEEDPKGPQRTAQTIEADVNEVITNIQNGTKHYNVRGIKGPFWFMFLKHFDVINGFVIDYMHGVCSGIMKLMLGLWFNKDKKAHSFSYFNHRGKVNEYLVKIKPTVFITRVPRSLDDLVHWKASEFRNFLLYWGVPVLRNILDNCHYLHFCALVKAIHILSQDSIKDTDIIVAENCLFNFVQLFPTLYSSRYMTMNMHQLVHLTDCVRATGPLFANNCFVFEDLNGYILEHIHGTQGIDTQIINTINIIQAIPIMAARYLKVPEIHQFYQMLRYQNHRDGSEIEPGIFSVGSVHRKILSSLEFDCILEKYTLTSNNVLAFNKIAINSSLCVYAQSYKRISRRNQSVVRYNDDVDGVCFCSVQHFIQFIDTADCVCNVALVNPFDCNYKEDDSIHAVVPRKDALRVVPINRIQKVCIFVEVDKSNYVCETPNIYDRD